MTESVIGDSARLEDVTQRLRNAKALLTRAEDDLRAVARRAAAGNRKAEVLISERKAEVQKQRENLVSIQEEYARTEYELGLTRAVHKVLAFGTNDCGIGTKTLVPDEKEYSLPEDELVTYAFENPKGEQFAIQMKGDGTFEFGTWDDEGEWVKLEIRRPCTNEQCKAAGHVVPYALDNYTKAGEPEGRLFHGRST